MNNLQSGIYQSLTDKVPIYDLADEDPEEKRSLAPLLVIIALVMLLAAFAGVVWLAYTQGAERDQQGASLATAPEGPLRVPPPEAATAPTGPNGNGYMEYVSPEQEATTVALAPQTASKAEPPLIRLEPPPAPAQVAKTEPPPIRLSQAAPFPAPAQADQGTGTSPSRALSGAAVLQLGAFESQELANSAWEAFRARYAMAANWAPDVQRADFSAKVIMYRLRVGPFADRTAATNACVQLKAAGANCFVAAP
jgi:cell division septation protein DedD